MDLVKCTNVKKYKGKKNIFQVSRFPIRAPTVQLFSKIGPVTSPGFLFNIARIFLQQLVIGVVLGAGVALGIATCLGKRKTLSDIRPTISYSISANSQAKSYWPCSSCFLATSTIVKKCSVVPDMF